MNSNGYLCSCMLSFFLVSFWTATHCGAKRGNCTIYGPRRNLANTGGRCNSGILIRTLKKKFGPVV